MAYDSTYIKDSARGKERSENLQIFMVPTLCVFNLTVAVSFIFIPCCFRRLQILKVQVRQLRVQCQVRSSRSQNKLPTFKIKVNKTAKKNLECAKN